MFNDYITNFYLGVPEIPDISFKPPKLYDLMDSICNYGKEWDERISAPNLAENCHQAIFDFNYPLTSNINKDKFEIDILNHYIMRRIGFETFTAFQIQLNNKLNEIMPKYNKMFDAFIDWDMFEDGETVTRNVADSGQSHMTSGSTGSSTSDRRYSNTPQNQIQDVQDGSYVTDYNYDQNSDTTTSETTGNDSRNTAETINRSPADKLKIYEEYMMNVHNVMSLIYKELDLLFYSLI